MFGGCLVRRRREMLIAPSAAASPCGNPSLAILGEIEQRFTGLFIDHGSADRHLHGHALAFVTRAVAALAMSSALGRVFRVEAEMQQRIAVDGRDHSDVAATPAVTTAGTSTWDVFLAPER